MLTVLYIFLVLALVLANGFFVAAEFALVGVRRSRISTLADAGYKRARLLLDLIDNLNSYISATQLGITMASLALGWIGEPVVAHFLEAPLRGRVSEAVLGTIAFGIAFTVITFLHIVLGELAPKTLALERTEKIALVVALPLQIFYKIFQWPIKLLDWAGTRTVRLIGLHPSAEHASIYTEEELRQLIESSHKSGYLNADEKKLINQVFDFAETEVREAMVPRTSVSALPLSADMYEIRETFRDSAYSRMPVYRERVDDVVGILFRRDLEPYLENPELPLNLKQLLHPPMFIPDTARLGEVLKRMQSTRTHFACVVDEHGGMEGIITLEDLLEEIVGEINDEYDQEARSQIIRDGESCIIDGMLAVRDANRFLKLKLPEDADYTTLAGFVLAQAGRLLGPGEFIDYNGARFTVERLDRRRIRRIRLTFTTRKGKESGASTLSFFVASFVSSFCQFE